MNYVNAAAAVEPGGSVKTHRAGGLGVGYVWGDGDGVLGGGGGSPALRVAVLAMDVRLWERARQRRRLKMGR